MSDMKVTSTVFSLTSADYVSSISGLAHRDKKK